MISVASFRGFFLISRCFIILGSLSPVPVSAFPVSFLVFESSLLGFLDGVLLGSTLLHSGLALYLFVLLVLFLFYRVVFTRLVLELFLLPLKLCL